MDPERGVPGGRLLAPFFAAGSEVFHALHDAGVLPRARLPAVVWSVGNLTVGGTGKTPAVLALTRAVREGGRRVAVLTRGYKGAGPGVLRGGRWTERPRRAGSPPDEALLLSRRLPDVPVVVGRDRAAGAARLLAEEAVDLFLLDDGFQHRRLARDRDLVLLDAQRPLGNGQRLPAGPLREGPRALRRAHVLLATGGLPGSPVAEPVRRLAEIHAPDARLLPAWVEPAGFRPLGEGGSGPGEVRRGATLLAVSGIARPERFHALLERMGCRVREVAAFGDHHRFDVEEVRSLEDRARGEGLRLVTTAKDEVRLEELPRRESWWVAEMELGVAGGWPALAQGLWGGENDGRGGS